MRRFLAALVLLPLLVLPGCQALGTAVSIARLDVKNPVTQAQVYQLASAYEGFLIVANAYRDLRPCKASETTIRNACRQQNILNELRRVARAAGPAIDKAEAFVRANDRINASSAFAAAQAAMDEGKRIRSLYGI